MANRMTVHREFNSLPYGFTQTVQ